ASFHNSSEDKPATTVRRLFHVGITSPGQGLLQIDVVGNAFLYNMVRVLAGTLLEVGQGRREGESVQEALQTGERSDAGVTAVASGLCLEEVFFLQDRLDEVVAELKSS
ncbi:MAG: tRNA pseudouridine(38-40) synthase TruA, partial [Planctomycetota bacterium]|nr:tRNA pseudouridine(38-40) synthase TruA [Planctomycetota bacterium]